MIDKENINKKITNERIINGKESIMKRIINKKITNRRIINNK